MKKTILAAAFAALYATSAPGLFADDSYFKTGAKRTAQAAADSARETGSLAGRGLRTSSHMVESGARSGWRTAGEVSRGSRDLAERGVKRSGEALEGIGERTMSSGSWVVEKASSPFQAAGRTFYHLVSPEADLNMPWNRDDTHSWSPENPYR